MDYYDLTLALNPHCIVVLKGSKKSTHYEWNFGDNTTKISGEGLENVKIQKHSYKLKGFYNVTVTATNEKRKTTVSTMIHVEGNALLLTLKIVSY